MYFLNVSIYFSNCVVIRACFTSWWSQNLFSFVINATLTCKVMCSQVRPTWTFFSGHVKPKMPVFKTVEQKGFGKTLMVFFFRVWSKLIDLGVLVDYMKWTDAKKLYGMLCRVAN